jgi:hypothetical protein
VAVAAGWLAATVLAHVPSQRMAFWIRRFDHAALIPIWTFFAPRPGTQDQVLVVRDVLRDGLVTDWRLVVQPRPPHILVRAIWNPEKRLDKLVNDCVGSVLTLSQLDRSFLALDVSHLLLQRLAEQAPHDFRAEHFEFAILRVSDFHGSPSGTLVYGSVPIPLT